MRTFALALFLLTPITAAIADEIPYEFIGLWSVNKKECVDKGGDNFNTFIGRNQIDQYEISCRLINIKRDGEGRNANMICNSEGETARGTVCISPTPQGQIIVDIRSKFHGNGRNTLALSFCGRDK